MDAKTVLAHNIKALMERNPELRTARKLAPHCTTATRKIAHLLDPKSDVQPQLDTIVAIAHAFRVKAWMLLCPEFDPSNKMADIIPPPEILALAQRIMRNREAFSEIFGTEPIPDSVLEENGWQAPTLHEPKKSINKKTPRQLKMKLGK